MPKWIFQKISGDPQGVCYRKLEQISNWKKLLGLRNMQEKLEKIF